MFDIGREFAAGAAALIVLAMSECRQTALGFSSPSFPPALTFSFSFAPPQPFSFLSPAPGKLSVMDHYRAARGGGRGWEGRERKETVMPN